MSKKISSKILNIMIASVLLFAVFFSISCKSIVKNISSNISFNYPGLRLETISLDKDLIKESYPVLVCFGDSVTFGWNLKYEESYPFLLKQKIDDDFKDALVINSGIGGDTVLDALNRVDDDVIDYNPEIVFSSFGLNDGMLMQQDVEMDDANAYFIENGETFYTRLSLIAFRDYYLELTELVKDSGSHIVILTTNPVLIDFPGERSEEFRKKQNEIYEIYNDEIESIAGEADVPLIDIKEAFEEKSNIRDFIQPDGIHPNSKGLELISETIEESGIINKLLEK